MTAQLEVYTFGGLRILRGGEPVTGLASRKVEALLVYLACTDRSQPREVLADFLWDDFSQTRAMNNLRVVLSNLRKHLGEYLIITRESVAMNPESNFRLDVVELEAALKAARARESRLGEQTSEAAAQLEAAVAHYQGEFLEGFSVRGSRGFDQWFSVERERLHRIVLNALRRLVSWHVVQGQFMKGIEQATRWLQLDPIAEAAHRQMMLLLAYSGQQGEALKQYETCLRVLAQELGTEPSAETEALYQKLLSGEPLPSIKPTGGLATRPPRVVGPCPYRGLAAFREEDAPFFFGREALVQQLAEAVRQRALVHVIVGSSGSGKSSVVYAGLLPRLREDGDWLIAQARPGSQPFQAAAAALLTLLEPELSEADRLIETQKLGQALTRGDVTLDSVARRTLEKDGNSSRLLLLLDQFEEIYTLCPDDELRRRYLDQLLAAVASSSLQRIPAMVFLLTLRADFMGQALGHRPFADTLQDAAFMIGPMTAEELQQAIQKPAELQGAAFEDGLVERILKDVGQEPGHLPLLEFALTLLWEKQKDGWLTHADYEEIGQVEGALARYADQVMDKLIQDEQEQARRIFVQLVRPGQGTEDTRRVATRSELGEDHWSLVRHLADRRLVVTGREESSDRETAEVVHEALIQRWGRLREWMAADRTFRTWQERLRAGLQGWQASRSDEGALLRGGPLAEAEDWLAQRAAQMSAAEREYIEASVALRQRREQEREAQRQRELETAQKLAEAERKRAEEQTQAADQLRLRRRYLLAALAVASLLAVAAIFFGIQFRRSALEAGQQSRVALARELAGRSAEVLPSDPELGLLLAIEAVNNTRQTDGFVTSEAEVALYRALASRDQRVLAGHADWIDAISFSPDGRRLVTASADGTARLWDLEGNHIATLEGHTDAIWSAAFSPDGERIVTSGDDGTARLWDAEGNLIITLEHPGGPVSVASFSPDGGRILTGSGDGTARLWDAKGNFLAALRGHTLDIQSAIFSPDGTRILTEGRNGRARLWDAEGSFIASLEAADVSYSGHIRGFYARKAVDFSPDGERIVTGSTDGPVLLWDIEGNLITILEGHTDRIWAARFSPNGEFIVTTSEDGTARLWDVEGNAITILEGHKARVWSIAFSPDGTQIVTGSTDGTARLWSIEGNPIATLEGHRDIVLPVTFSPDGKRVATGSFDRTARLWDVEGFSITRLTGHAGWVHQVTFHPDGERILTASVDGTARLWDMTGRVLQTFDGEGGEIWSAAFNQDGSQIVTAGDDGTIRQWDSDGALINVLGGHDGAVRWVDFSPAGDRMVTAGDDGSAHLWGSDGTLLATLEGHAGPLRSADFSPDGQHILTVGFSDFSPRLWDAGGNFLARLLGHELPVETAAFSADGEHIVTAGQDGTTKIWDIDGALLATLEVDSVFEPRVRFSADRARISDSVRSARFSPDGTRVLTGSDDNTARLWDLSGNLVATLEGHTGAVTWVEFSPGGGRIATASQDGTARLWNREGIFLAILEGHTGPVIWGNFSPDGTLLSTASEDGSVRVWQILESIDAMLATAEERVRRSLTEAECQLYLHRERCP